ncbi:hypothetical protein HDV05_004613 [Chytridiales sp. JEL 0842]|nr:hypothetical protein HDV05_004613 [Chytridiales sp. JEL 0842]
MNPDDITTPDIRASTTRPGNSSLNIPTDDNPTASSSRSPSRGDLSTDNDDDYSAPRSRQASARKTRSRPSSSKPVKGKAKGKKKGSNNNSKGAAASNLGDQKQSDAFLSTEDLGKTSDSDASEEEEPRESATSILGSIVNKLNTSNQPSNSDSEDSPKPFQHQDSSQTDLTNPIPTDPDEAQLYADLQKTLNFLTEQSQEQSDSTNTSQPNEAVIRIRQEYEKLHKLFLQSRKNEQNLVRKCKDLNSELSSNAAKVAAALKLSQADRGTIAALKKEVKKAWKMVENAGEKEQRAKDAIARLKVEVETVRREGGGEGGVVATSSGETVVRSTPISGGYNNMIAAHVEQDAIINKLRAEKESLIQQQATMTENMKTLQTDFDDLKEKCEILKTDKIQLRDELESLKELMFSKKTEQDRETRNREKAEQQVKQSNELLKTKELELVRGNKEISSLKERLALVESILKEEKLKVDKELKEKEILLHRISRLQNDLDDKSLETTKLQTQAQQFTSDIKSWEEELDKYKEEYRGITRMKEMMQKKVKMLEEGKLAAEVERDTLKNINHSLTHEHETFKRELENAQKQLEHLTRERDIAQKNFVKATGATQKQMSAVKLADQTKRNLEHEIIGYKDEAAKMRKLIYALEKDRDRHINTASQVQFELDARDQELKMKEMLIFDSRKKIMDLEKKLKEQQALYENVRADRNLYSKNLIESQDEINEMRRKVKIMSHQIEQLKEEIGNKDSALAKQNGDQAKLEKEKEGLSSTIAKLKEQNEETVQKLQNKTAEENKLKNIINDMDQERLAQKKELDSVVQERDILGTQLIRRNEELSLLYEKIKIQTSTLNKGEIQYRERLEDIRVLRLEIKKLRREKAILQTETQNVDGLKNEIFKLQREVLKERTRVKVLEEELESPMNIHRWRKLQGSDPSTYELITKIQTLQKRLISKTEEVVEKELIIGQKEKLYKEIKEVLQRQPGPEVVEELRVVKEAVKSKIRECKSLASELNMYHTQVNEYKYEIERLNRDYQLLKKKYYERKRKERETKQLQQQYHHTSDAKSTAETPNLRGHLHQQLSQYQQYAQSILSKSTHPNSASNSKVRPNLSAGPRFSGGGFNMGNNVLLERGKGSVLGAVVVSGEEADQIHAAGGDENEAVEEAAEGKLPELSTDGGNRIVQQAAV